MVARKYARICWNIANWQRPTGAAKDGPKTFFGVHRFGFEEWLLDRSANIDGWQYAFLQPINHGYARVVGTALSLRLYTIPGGGQRQHHEVFELSRCEVLTPAHAEEAVAEFRANGRLRRMIEEVKAIARSDVSPLQKPNPYCEHIVNVRFRLHDVRPVPHRRPSLRADYYHLYDIPGQRGSEAADTRADEIDAGEQFEGRRMRVYVNAYERNPKARSQCLAKWGFCCTVCGISFKTEYGPIGDGFIHVHHLRPLSQIRKSYRVDGARDLRPVCPNCHAMLHHGTSPPSIEELREYRRVAETWAAQGQ